VRIWSLHPALLDRQALVACWRETLLAQAVLRGATTGYRHHPQLDRFRARPEPLVAIATYLDGLAVEADARGYRFDRRRIVASPDRALSIPVTGGQVRIEWRHLLGKLEARSPERFAAERNLSPRPHPLFREVPGDPEPWERLG
jgi:hypothetical protein